MSLNEKEFVCWLNNKNKTFIENLRFALKALKSPELTLGNKFEIALKWISEQKGLLLEEVSKEDFEELFSLSIPSNQISQQVKSDITEWFLTITNQYFNTDSSTKREWPELLKALLECELMQDLYRFNYKLMSRLYAHTYKCYGYYLKKCLSHCEEKPSRITPEATFFQSIIRLLKNAIKHVGDVNMYEKSYTKYILEPLIQIIVQFQSYSINFLEDLIDIENLITHDLKDNELIERILKQSEATRLITLECALINRKSSESFVQFLIAILFGKAQAESSSALDLLMIASVLDLFNRYDINLNIKIDNEQTALKCLSNTLSNYIKSNLNDHFQEVLILLCFTLQFNPLILEQYIFEITAVVMLLPKSVEYNEVELYKQYLIIFVNLFGHIQKAEKCIMNFLKAVGKHLENINVVNATIKTKKRKSTQGIVEESPTKIKRQKTSKENMPILMKKYSSSSIYEQVLYQKLFKIVLNIKPTTPLGQSFSAGQSFGALQKYWPSNSVGLTYSKIVANLLSKPSISMWKTLLHSLKDLLTFMLAKTDFNENELFYLDFQCSLLSQYFAGCKLAEKCENNIDAIQSNCDLTYNILSLLGQVVLQHKNLNRLMIAFLELSYYFTSFEITLAFYKSSFYSLLNGKIHTFVNAQQWTFIEQSVLRLNEIQCKYLLQRLHFQRIQAEFIFNGKTATMKTGYDFPVKIFKGTEHLLLANSSSHVRWLLSKCERSDKKSLAKYTIRNIDHNLSSLSCLYEDEDSVIDMALIIYKDIFKRMSIKDSCIKDLLSLVEASYKHFDFNVALMELQLENCVPNFISLCFNQSEINTKMNAWNQEKIQALAKLLNALSRVHIGQLGRTAKMLLFYVHLFICFNIKNHCQENLYQQALLIIEDFFHFGQPPSLFCYMSTHQFFNTFPINKFRNLYELIFSFIIKSDPTDAENFFIEIISVLTKTLSSSKTIIVTPDELYLLVMSIKTLHAMEKRHFKRLKNYSEQFLNMFGSYIQSYIKRNDIIPSKEDSNNKDDNRKSSQCFILETLPVMPLYVTTIVNTNEFSDEFRRIIKIYLGLSVNYFNTNSVNLVQIVLNHRDKLHLDHNEIEFILTKCWDQLKSEYIVKSQNFDYQENTMESAIKVIISNKTNEDFLIFLRSICIELNENAKCIKRILFLLKLMAKCTFSTIKGAIFNDQYKHITNYITLQLMKLKERTDDEGERGYFRCYCDSFVMLLQCHLAFINNKTIIMTTDSLDTILILLIDTNLKKFLLKRDNLNQFYSLYAASINILTALIKNYTSLERIPQYTHIFKDLIQAVMLWCYKNDSNQSKIMLSYNEVDMLSELYYKLENLVNMITHHSVHFKRVTPFLLIFIINLYVVGSNASTHNNKIKAHIENICRDLIKICDHRAGHFILRCLNEGGRKFYETLLANYLKYYKFKGKI